MGKNRSCIHRLVASSMNTSSVQAGARLEPRGLLAQRLGRSTDRPVSGLCAPVLEKIDVDRQARSNFKRLDGELNTPPSRTPVEGQRRVTFLRFVWKRTASGPRGKWLPASERFQPPNVSARMQGVRAFRPARRPRR